MPDGPRPPAANEAEVSLFGPGFGECVLVHLGAGEWLLVDSCIDQVTRAQPALRYLEQIGHDPVRAVKIIVASHWHDDHVRGLAETVRRCSGATFYCSSALTESDSLVFFGTQAAHTYHSGGREFHEVLQALEARTPRGGVLPIHWAISGNRIFHRGADEATPERTVFALSPSQAAVTLAKLALPARSCPKLGSCPGTLLGGGQTTTR